MQVLADKFFAVQNVLSANVRNAALYLRLSRDDYGRGDNDSISIANQREFLITYCEENGINIVDIYIDDGYTGTNFNRPDFKRMIEDVESGIIDTVIVKDLSRLGRDYIDTGYYLEKYFPSNSVQFIAINDGINTFSNDSNNDMSPFKAVINDMYARDISKKVRATFRTKMKQGYFLSAHTPYGYRIDPNQKGHFVIDENVADIVRKIYGLFLEGNTYVSIADILEAEGTETPSEYKKRISNLNSTAKHGRWHPTTIGRILENQTYIGSVVQNRASKISYKIDKYKMNPKDKLIIVPNMHEPIIDKKTFELAQGLRRKGCSKGKPVKKRTVHLLSGLLYCSECGGKITFRSSEGKFYTICQAYSNHRSECKSHAIVEHRLEKRVLDLLKEEVNKYIDREKILRESEKFDADCGIHTVEKEENECRAKIEKTRNNITRIYEDRLSEMIDEVTSRNMLSLKNQEVKRLEKQLSEITSRKENIEIKTKNEIIIEAMKSLLELEKPDKLTLSNLINKIIIYEDKSIDVQFAFKIPKES